MKHLSPELQQEMKKLLKQPRFFRLDADNRVVPSDVMGWAQRFENNNHIVGMTQITSEVTVSTVFLGLNHRYFGNGPPIVFETMIFGGPLDQEQWRYSSWDDAETGHKMAVRKARAAQKQKITQR